MAHYVASINLFEHADGPVSASLKVFRVYEFGAAPRRPVWEGQALVERPTEWNPTAWLRAALEALTEQLDG